MVAYQAQLEWPVARLLSCDDAPRFTWITDELAGCWVHTGRHYKKLLLTVALQRELLDMLLKDFWGSYAALLAYRRQPTAEDRARLVARVDVLFAMETGYWAEDARMHKTRTKQACLLLVLAHPEIPLHTNPTESGHGSACASGRAALARGRQGGPKRGIPSRVLGLLSFRLLVCFACQCTCVIRRRFCLPRRRFCLRELFPPRRYISWLRHVGQLY